MVCLETMDFEQCLMSQYQCIALWEIYDVVPDKLIEHPLFLCTVLTVLQKNVTVS